MKESAPLSLLREWGILLTRHAHNDVRFCRLPGRDPALRIFPMPDTPTIGATKMINNTLGERVHQIIRRDIISGKYPPGTRLFFETIAKETGVSMTPVKEAFMLLEKEGLVFTVARKGTFVRELSARDLDEYYQIRLALEALAVDLICARGLSEDDEAGLKQICDSLERHIKNQDAAECVMDDVRFHNQLVRASGNAQLLHLINTLPLTNLFNMLNWADFYLSRGNDYLAEHRRIIQHLRKRDAECIKKLLHKHIDVNRTKKEPRRA